jgi:NADP-reducing hydrogenase subunit HndB
MPGVKSLEDLQDLRDETLKKRELVEQSAEIEITVGIGTPGIAVGARETMKAILQFIEREQISGVTVRQTGNIGMDSWEPIMKIRVRDFPVVTYGKITADLVEPLLRSHLLKNKPLSEFVIDA